MTTRTLSKEKIIAAAVEFINDQETITFTKLGRKLGTRAQAIYNYFPDVCALKTAVAIQFYDELAIRLQADLLGLTGKQAIKTFANVSVQYALGKFQICRTILGVSSQQLTQSLSAIHEILNQLLLPFIADKKSRLIMSQMLRNLIVGEVVHVGNNRFNNDLISSRDSFDKMLEMVLEGV